jgi:hypothetical protein
MTKGYSPQIPDTAPKKGEVYKHYKGDSYEVVTLALHSNDDSWMVVYKPLYENPDAEMFTRLLRDWSEEVVYQDTHVRRFTLVK